MNLLAGLENVFALVYLASNCKVLTACCGGSRTKSWMAAMLWWLQDYDLDDSMLWCLQDHDLDGSMLGCI
jgi:hypothetical protein